jgi:hypothetical protein
MGNKIGFLKQTLGTHIRNTYEIYSIMSTPGLPDFSCYGIPKVEKYTK